MNEHIKAVAVKEGRDPSEVYEEIQKAIDYAWKTADSGVGMAQLGLMGSREVPSPDELIAAVLDRINRYGK